MSDPDELVRMTKQALKTMLQEAERIGFNKAIEMLRSPDQDEFNAGITNCMHANEWANWLESKKEEFLK
jgi:hypothetical protein